MTVAALIVAAGRGSRALEGTHGVAKQYFMLSGQTVLARTTAAFLSHPLIDAVQVVIHPDDADAYAASVAGMKVKLLDPIMGGSTRQQSVLLGLRELARHTYDSVLIHDAARPFIASDTIALVIDALKTTAGAIAATPVSDTVKRATETGLISATVDRTRLWRAQTPQGFSLPEILKAHESAAAGSDRAFTDDASIAEWAGLPVILVPSSEANTKITTPDDLAMAELRFTASQFETRTGSGFDVHRFTEGDHVWLAGVKIPHTHKLEGHSDADVALHALTDALLGAIGDGDIGQHFPPSDPQWKGAASHLFLADAARRVTEKGGKIVNVDITLLAESPRVGPHRPAMQKAISDVLKIDITRVGIKATTTEGLGFTGRREGIAAMATATVQMPV